MQFIVCFKWRILGLEHKISGRYMLCVQTRWHDLVMSAITLTYTRCQALVKAAGILLVTLHSFLNYYVYLFLDFFEDEMI